MYILIIGAGMSGLATALSLSLTGHNVTILESASTLAKLGAGVQMTPNATKYLWQWGLGPDILSSATLPGGFFVRDAQTGNTLGSVPFDQFEERYGAPYLVIHRADIHRILHQHAVRAGVVVRLGCRVEEMDLEAGEVTVLNSSGSLDSDAKGHEKIKADLVVGADGIHSAAREALCPSSALRDDGLEKTGWAAYRVIAQMDKIQSHATSASSPAFTDLVALLSDHDCNCWVGANSLIMTYLVKGSQVLNIVVSHQDDVDTSTWTPEQYVTAIQGLTKDFDPSLKELLRLTEPGIQNWPISQVPTLPRWTSESGQFVLLGDAAHAMAFYLSMGVSMAIEDATALTECISLMDKERSTTADPRSGSDLALRKAMQVFERVRKSRAEAVRDASLHAGRMLQLPQGQEREARDHALGMDGLDTDAEYEAEGELFYKNVLSYGILDRRIRDWCYGYDVLGDVRRVWDAAVG